MCSDSIHHIVAEVCWVFSRKCIQHSIGFYRSNYREHDIFYFTGCFLCESLLRKRQILLLLRRYVHIRNMCYDCSANTLCYWYRRKIICCYHQWGFKSFAFELYIRPHLSELYKLSRCTVKVIKLFYCVLLS